jgi:O-antigen/teichoic acid export membrane protein
MTDNDDKIKNFSTRFQDLTTFGFGTVIATVISGLFWLYLASLLGTESYGEISYFIAISGIAAVISFVGAGNMLVVYTAKDVKIQPTVYLISIIASLVSSAVLFFIFYNVGVSVYVIGYVVFALATSELLGRKLYKTYSKYLIIQRLLMVGLTIGLYYLLGQNGVILGIALSHFPFIPRIYKGFKEIKIDFVLVKSRFNFMMNSYVSDLAKIFSGSIDKLLIGPLFGFALLGNYHLGIQFLGLLGVLPNIVYQYILPHDATGNRNNKLKVVTILFSVCLAIASIFLAPLVLPYFFPKFVNAVEILQILSIAVVPLTINLMYTSRLLGDEKNKMLLVGSGIYVASEIISILGLGGSFGVKGIASAIVIASVAEMIFLVSVGRSKKT